MQQFTQRITDRHTYYGLSVEGRHTPGANSDELCVLKNLSPAIPFLALVADGVTGNNLDKRVLAGKFVAQQIIKLFPDILLNSLQNTDASVVRVLPEVIKKTNIEIVKPFADRFSQLYLQKQQDMYGASTIAGIIETEKEFILFGAGDSSVFALDKNYELLEDSATEMHRDPFGRLTSAITVYHEGGIFLPYFPEQISIKEYPKHDNAHRFIVCTDGLTPAGSIFELAYYLTYAGKSRPSELAREAFAYAKVIEDTEGMIPDDKTIVVVKG